MAQTVWCRFCGTPDEKIGGRTPDKCRKCEGVNHWMTELGPLIERRKRPMKGPRMKFALNHNDYRLFLKRIRVSPD